MGATSPVEGICCPHGNLLPEAASTRAKRAVVPQPVWEHICNGWTAEAAQRSEAAQNRDKDGPERQSRSRSATPHSTHTEDDAMPAAQPSSTGQGQTSSDAELSVHVYQSNMGMLMVSRD